MSDGSHKGDSGASDARKDSGRIPDSGRDTTSGSDATVDVTSTHDASVDVTSTHDASVDSARPIDATADASRHVDAAVDSARPIDATADASRHVDAAADVAGPLDAAADASQKTDAAFDGSQGTRADGQADHPIDASVDSGGTCSQPSADSVWADITTASSPTNIQAIVAGEVWGISIGKLVRWDGTTWATVTVPFTWATTLGIVRGSSAHDVWVTNGAAGLFHWDGANWTDLSPPGLPSGSRVIEMRVLGPNEAWLINSYPLPVNPQNGNVYYQSMVLHWDGAGWTQVPLPAEAQPVANLVTLWATTSNDVWMGGDIIQPTVTQNGYLFHWDGTAIRLVDFGPFQGTRQFIEGIWASGPSNVWVAGGSAIGAKLSHYDGSAWTEIGIPSGQGAFTGVWGWCASSVWAISNGGIWHYDGTMWSQSNSKLQFLGAVSGTGSDDAWVSGTYGNGSVLSLRWQPNTCGDQVIGPGEQCDPPTTGSVHNGGPICDSTCHLVTCGNLVIDPGETCDPPNETTCDDSCQSIPIVCGNGIVQPGESCDLGVTSPALCRNCQLTNCGGCLAQANGGLGCTGLSSADSPACNALITCAATNMASCAEAIGAVGCYCSNASCSAGANGPCVSQFQALAHSSDPAVVLAQMADPSTPVGQVAKALNTFARSSCGSTCFTNNN